MPTQPNKQPKLREFKCKVCSSIFYRNISPAEIKKGRGSTCSHQCHKTWVGLKNRRGEYRICARCGGKFWSKPSEDRRNCIRRYCSFKCLHPVERGKSISTDGYYIINNIKVHRLIMEEHIGRKLLPTEIVHHINHDRFDNRIENLQIVTRSEHNKIHKFLRR